MCRRVWFLGLDWIFTSTAILDHTNHLVAAITIKKELFSKHKSQEDHTDNDDNCTVEQDPTWQHAQNSHFKIADICLFPTMGDFHLLTHTRVCK